MKIEDVKRVRPNQRVNRADYLSNISRDRTHKDDDR